MLKAQMLEFDRMISAWHRRDTTSTELDEIPGAGHGLATALDLTPRRRGYAIIARLPLG
jgi:hypothetical protein